MTIDEFRTNEALSTQLNEILKTNEVLRIALGVCDQAAPANGGVKIAAEHPHIAHIQLGIDRGYNLYPQVLRLLATPLKAAGEVPATYEPKEEGS